MSLLPIYQVSNSLLAALKNSNQVLLHAPTGAGKSTALPLEILKSGVIEGELSCWSLGVLQREMSLTVWPSNMANPSERQLATV